MRERECVCVRKRDNVFWALTMRGHSVTSSTCQSLAAFEAEDGVFYSGPPPLETSIFFKFFFLSFLGLVSLSFH